MGNISEKQHKEVKTTASERMLYLVDLLNKASNAYYNEDTEIMSNFEYDAYYDELCQLEEKEGLVLENSPTQKAGFEVVSNLQTAKHEFPALSLDKTKSRVSLIPWLNGKEGVLSWKMDGLTVVATYNNGKLISAVTRGNGYVGEIVTHNAKHFKGLPRTISFKKKLIVRGEAVMSYKDFEAINNEIPDIESKYKNARNLASATVRLLDANKSAQRPISLFVFDLVFREGNNGENALPKLKSEQFKWLESLGFNVVEHKVVSGETIVREIENFENKLLQNPFPSDGLVLIFNDDEYGKSLGMTGKFPRNGIAFKWKDETVSTKITDIEWSASRTGLLNPVAIFEPVEIEGTTVSRASVHNVSIAENLQLGIGSTVEVLKANKIIPQIAKTTKSTGETLVPDICPICGHKTQIRENDGIKTLYCTNPECSAKHVGKYVHFCARDCMNILGMSEATVSKFIECGIIKEYADFFHFEKHPEIKTMEGFGEKSFQKMISSSEDALNKADFVHIIHSFGIPNVGLGQAKLLKKAVEQWSYEMYPEFEMTYFDCLARMSETFDFETIDGFGQIIAKSLLNWIDKNMVKDTEVMNFITLVPALWIPKKEEKKSSAIAGKTFVITGSVNHYKNRDALKEFIESLGGKVSGSVSAKTDFLINNDVTSTSGKNKKAKELGVKIISEDEFIALSKR